MRILNFAVVNQEALSLRKRYLFNCACCRRVDHLLYQNYAEHIYEIEQAVDNKSVNIPNIDVQIGGTLTTAENWASNAIYYLIGENPNNWTLEQTAKCVVCALRDKEVGKLSYMSLTDHYTNMCNNYLKDICGTVMDSLEPIPDNWKTNSVLGLAKEIYENYDFALLPILADNLEDVGCTNKSILQHCRDQDLHVKGCWLIDMILDKN
jgi:hypothetical protein